MPFFSPRKREVTYWQPLVWKHWGEKALEFLEWKVCNKMYIKKKKVISGQQCGPVMERIGKQTRKKNGYKCITIIQKERANNPC